MNPLWKRAPLTQAELSQRSAAGKASALARHKGETTPSIRQGSTSEPSPQAKGLFRQGQSRPDTRARRGVWDTRTSEPTQGATNATFTFHFPKAYRSKTPDRPRVGPRGMAQALARVSGPDQPHQDVVVANPRQLAEAQRHPQMRAILEHTANVVREHMALTIERGHENGLIPEGTKPATVARAYKHAALRAMHKAGLGDYDTAMDPAAKAEFTPLVPFMRYAHRRVFDHLNQGPLKGKWAPFRDEYGQLFRQKFHGQYTGKTRMRMRPAEEFIKMAVDLDDLLEKRWTHYSMLEGGRVDSGHAPSRPANPIKGAARRVEAHLGAPAMDVPRIGGSAERQANGLYRVVPPGELRKTEVPFEEPLDKEDFGFRLGDYNVDPQRQLARAMRPRMHHNKIRLRLNTQRDLRHQLNGGVTRQERWQLGASMGGGSLGKQGAFEEREHPRGEHGHFTSKEAADNPMPWTTGQKVAVALPTVAATAVGAHGGVIHAVLAHDESTLGRLKAGGKGGMMLGLLTALATFPLSLAVHDTSALIRKKPEHTLTSGSRNEIMMQNAMVGGLSSAVVLAGSTFIRPGLAMQARALPVAAGWVGRRLPVLGPKVAASLAASRKAVLRAVRERAKSTEGTLVHRGAQATADFDPRLRGYNAVYVAKKKSVTSGYGAGFSNPGSVTTFRLSPKAKLLNTAIRLPEHDELDRTPELASRLHLNRAKRAPVPDAETMALFDRLIPPGEKAHLRVEALRDLHWAPTARQIEIMKEAGYHGSVGTMENVALHEPSLLTPLYAQSRYTGAVHFASKAKMEKSLLGAAAGASMGLGALGKSSAFDERKHPRGKGGHFETKGHDDDDIAAKPWTTGIKVALGVPLATSAAIGLNEAALSARAAPSGLLSRVKAGGKAGVAAAAGALTFSGMLSIALHDATVLTRHHPDQAILADNWHDYAKDTLIPGLLGGAGMYFRAGHLAGGLALQARAAPAVTRNAVAAAIPAYGRKLAARRLGVLRAARTQAKAAEGTLVYRGAPAADFEPTSREFNAVYVAHKKGITNSYGDKPGNPGVVTTYRLRPETKLLNTDVRLKEHGKGSATGHSASFLTAPLPTPWAKPIDPELAPLFDKLLAPEANQRKSPFGALHAARPSRLRDLHWQPTKEQIQILKEHGYHGTIGPARNVALHDDGFLTPLYARDRYTGAMQFAPKAKMEKSLLGAAAGASMGLGALGKSSAFDERKHPRGKGGHFETKATADDYKPWTTGQKVAVALPVAVGAAVGAHGGIINAVLAHEKSVLGHLKAGGKAGLAFALGTTMATLPLSLVVHDTTALIRKKPGDTLKSNSWKQIALEDAAGTALSAGTILAGAAFLRPSLAMQARAAPVAARWVGGRLPIIGAKIAPSRAAVLRAVRERAKSAEGTLVHRGAPSAADFDPQLRRYNAIYVAHKKSVTDGYGAMAINPGSVTTFRLSPKAKLLNTAVRLPEHDALGSFPGTTSSLMLDAAKDAPAADAETMAMLDQLIPPGDKAPLRVAALRDLHWAPTARQIKIMKEAGYHGSIGPMRNVALHDPSLLTPLYAQSRYTGAVQFAPKAKMAKSLLGAAAGAAAFGGAAKLAGGFATRRARGALHNAFTVEMKDALRQRLHVLRGGSPSPEMVATANKTFRAAKVAAMQRAKQAHPLNPARPRTRTRTILGAAAMGGTLGLMPRSSSYAMPPLYQSAAQQPDGQP